MSADLLMLPPQDEVARLWAPRLAKEVPGVNVIVAEDEDEAIAVLRNGVRAAYGTLNPGLLEVATGLAWLQAPMAAPPAGYYFPELTAHPVVVTNMRDTYTDHVSTHAVALLLSLARNLPYYLRKQIDRSWAPDKREETILHFPEATVLIVGLGALGECIATLLRPLGCRIVGTDARREEKPDSVDEMGRPEDLDAYLAEADAVVLTVPHTPETYKLIDEHRLGLMKPSALLVNVGRGAVVDIDALATALCDGVIRGAAIDVVPEEPLPEEHLLWSEPRAIVTPHVAAVGPHKEERRFAVLRENTERFLAGGDLLNIVDKAAWF
jgi:phosphoglycerate dehydrogenase-like enzyme